MSLPEEDEADVLKLREELEEERKRGEDLLNRLKYAQADLENIRKRADKEAREAGEADLRGLVGRLIQVQDELDLAVLHSGEGSGGSDLREGIMMVRRNLAAALESVGVSRVECLGRPFDPSVHEAVEKTQGAGEGEDVVVEELRPGYTFRGQLMRPSMVKVELAAKKRAEEAKANE